MDIACPENTTSVDITITEQESIRITSSRWDIDIRYLIAIACVSVLLFGAFFIIYSPSALYMSAAEIPTTTAIQTPVTTTTTRNPTTTSTTFHIEKTVDVDGIINKI